MLDMMVHENWRRLASPLRRERDFAPPAELARALGVWQRASTLWARPACRSRIELRARSRTSSDVTSSVARASA